MRSLFGTPPEEKAQEPPKPEEAKKQDPKEQGEVTAADIAATKKVKASRTKGRQRQHQPANGADMYNDRYGTGILL